MKLRNAVFALLVILWVAGLESQPSDQIGENNFLTNPYSRLVRDYIAAELEAGHALQLKSKVDQVKSQIVAGSYSASEKELNALDSNLQTVIGTTEAIILEGRHFDSYNSAQAEAALQELQGNLSQLEGSLEPDEVITEDFDYYYPADHELGYQEQKKDLVESAIEALRELHILRGQPL